MADRCKKLFNAPGASLLSISAIQTKCTSWNGQLVTLHHVCVLQISGSFFFRCLLKPRQSSIESRRAARFARKKI